MSVEALKNPEPLSKICVELCKGACCDPWWGIIFYTLKKRRTESCNDFRKDLAASITERAERIKSRYVTREDPPRPLFNDPERYNVRVENITPAPDGSLLVNLRAMFAFRCVFLAPDKRCSVHPAITGEEIRPPHCSELGRAGIKPGEKGYCRIIEAAVKTSGDEKAIASAIGFERETSEKHYNEGFSTIDEAAERAINGIKEFSFKKTAQLMPAEKANTPGRNDPCFCGSGLKYKKCHGG